MEVSGRQLKGIKPKEKRGNVAQLWKKEEAKEKEGADARGTGRENWKSKTFQLFGARQLRGG